MGITIESPLKLRKRIRATFSPSTTVEELNQMRQEAYTSLLALDYLIGTTPLQLVDFYKEVSPWCDRSSELYELERKIARIDYGQHLKARKALVALAAQDERCRNGINRTSPEQAPSVHTTFLGERCQLSTEPVSYWESIREGLGSKPALIGRSDSPTVMEVIDAQASTFLSQGLARWQPLFQALIDA